LTNKTLQFTLADACEVICVRHAARPPQAAPHAPRSHTSKQNTVLRSNVAPQRCARFALARSVSLTAAA